LHESLAAQASQQKIDRAVVSEPPVCDELERVSGSNSTPLARWAASRVNLINGERENGLINLSVEFRCTIRNQLIDRR
jgi:hypothetical protein